MPATWTVRSKIQSIARQNRAGAKMQPCRTPEDVRKLENAKSMTAAYSKKKLSKKCNNKGKNAAVRKHRITHKTLYSDAINVRNSHTKNRNKCIHHLSVHPISTCATVWNAVVADGWRRRREHRTAIAAQRYARRLLSSSAPLDDIVHLSRSFATPPLQTPPSHQTTVISASK